MEKVIKDGLVAVLYSPSFGAGWYTWHHKKELLFHPVIVSLVEKERRDLITEELCQSLLKTADYVCVLGAQDLNIGWLPEGSKFIIREYDGSETIEMYEDIPFLEA